MNAKTLRRFQENERHTRVLMGTLDPAESLPEFKVLAGVITDDEEIQSPPKDPWSREEIIGCLTDGVKTGTVIVSLDIADMYTETL